MSHLPVPNPGDPLERQTGERAVSQSDGGRLRRELSVPSVGHHAGQMQFIPSTGGRGDHWNRLPPKIRQRLDAPPDDKSLEWWAYNESAVMFRRKALVTVRRRRDRRFEVRSVPLDPASHQTYKRNLIPDLRTRPPTPPTLGASTCGSGPPPPRPANTPPLPEHFAQFLGNLPLIAQQFMQAPFADAIKEPLCDYHYESTEKDDLTELLVWCYVANRSHVTFLSASRFTPPATDPFAATSHPWQAHLWYAAGIRGRESQ